MGNCWPPTEWIEVFAMEVPSHIGHPGGGYEEGDPYADFLPPPCGKREYHLCIPRAIVIVARDRDQKKGQQYVDALVVMSGNEYEETSFPGLLTTIIKARKAQDDSRADQRNV